MEQRRTRGHNFDPGPVTPKRIKVESLVEKSKEIVTVQHQINQDNFKPKISRKCRKKRGLSLTPEQIETFLSDESNENRTNLSKKVLIILSYFHHLTPYEIREIKMSDLIEKDGKIKLRLSTKILELPEKHQEIVRKYFDKIFEDTQR